MAALTRRASALFLVLVFMFVTSMSDLTRSALAQDNGLPIPNALLSISKPHAEPVMVGFKFDPQKPYDMEFLFDSGDEKSVAPAVSQRLIRMFFAALTVPENKLWVNLSPFEADRVIEPSVATTELGDAFLSQDYLLKQLSSSLTVPDTDTGKAYWAIMNGTKTDARNKIWIIPGHIELYDGADTVAVTNATLKVQTESDYLASQGKAVNDAQNTKALQQSILPVIEKEVNGGAQFSQLRQMYHSVILANWFKRKFAHSLYSFYFNSERVKGVDLGNPAMKGDVFARYAQSFNGGVYNTTAKMVDASTGRKTKRQYFSGGVALSGTAGSSIVTFGKDKAVAAARWADRGGRLFLTQIRSVLVTDEDAYLRSGKEMNNAAVMLKIQNGDFGQELKIFVNSFAAVSARAQEASGKKNVVLDGLSGAAAVALVLSAFAAVGPDKAIDYQLTGNQIMTLFGVAAFSLATIAVAVPRTQKKEAAEYAAEAKLFSAGYGKTMVSDIAEGRLQSFALKLFASSRVSPWMLSAQFADDTFDQALRERQSVIRERLMTAVGTDPLAVAQAADSDPEYRTLIQLGLFMRRSENPGAFSDLDSWERNVPLLGLTHFAASSGVDQEKVDALKIFIGGGTQMPAPAIDGGIDLNKMFADATVTTDSGVAVPVLSSSAIERVAGLTFTVEKPLRAVSSSAFLAI